MNFIQMYLIYIYIASYNLDTALARISLGKIAS